MRECVSGHPCSKLIFYAQICMKTCDVFSFGRVEAFPDRRPEDVLCKFEVKFDAGKLWRLRRTNWLLR